MAERIIVRSFAETYGRRSVWCWFWHMKHSFNLLIMYKVKYRGTASDRTCLFAQVACKLSDQTSGCSDREFIRARGNSPERLLRKAAMNWA